MTGPDAKNRAARRTRGLTFIYAAAMGLIATLAWVAPVAAQGAGWQADVEVKKQAAPAAKGPKPPAQPNTTVIERNEGKTGAAGGSQIKLVALLTEDGQQIDQGLIWRVYASGAEAQGKSKLVTENREPSPSLKLQPGDYTVNAAFGRANLTRKITIKAGAPATERFVLNAGGLRLLPTVAGKPTPPNSVAFSIFADDRDQFGGRAPIMTGARPGLVIRLNAGIYHIASTYGDANAKVETDVTVEAGKLSEISVSHSAGRANFKLVTRAGGEALPDTHWTIQSSEGETVKESVGALPTHMLAPGTYTATAKAAGRTFKKQFAVSDGDMATVELVMDAAGAASDLPDFNPSLEIKNP